MCQGFSHFSGFLHHFVLAKLATSSIRVNINRVKTCGNVTNSSTGQKGFCTKYILIYYDAT